MYKAVRHHTFSGLFSIRNQSFVRGSAKQNYHNFFKFSKIQVNSCILTCSEVKMNFNKKYFRKIKCCLLKVEAV